MLRSDPRHTRRVSPARAGTPCARPAAVKTHAPLKLGYIYTRPVPSRETDTQQVLSTLDALGGAGVDVELILPGSYRRLFTSAAAYEAEVRAFYDVHRPFRLRRVFTFEPGPTQIERPAHALAAALGRARRYDLVHTRSRATVPLCVALRVPVVFETYRRLGHDAPRVAAMLARLAKSPYFLGVITHSLQSADSLAMAGVPRDKLRVLHNGHDPRKLEPRQTRASARAALALPLDAKIALYTGNVQAQKGLDTVLDMASATPDVTYLVVGGKDKDLAALEADVARRGLTNVHCPGWRPASALAPYFYAADVLLIPPTARPLVEHGRTVLPMKVFGYLAAGRPILGPALPDLAEVLVDGHSACLVAPDDSAAAVTGLRRVLDDPAYAAAIADGALAASADLTWDARAMRLVDQYRTWLAAARR